MANKREKWRCAQCHEIKFKSEFRFHKNRGFITTCKICEAKRRKKYYKETGK